MREINEAGVLLIKSFEGFRAEPYKDGGGKLTVGFGHLIQPGEDFSAGVTEPQAELLLANDLATAEDDVQRLVSVPVNDNQFSALVSLTYNIGTTPLLKTLGDKLNAADYDGASLEFQRWVHCDGAVCDGLVRRRDAERALFETPTE